MTDTEIVAWLRDTATDLPDGSERKTALLEAAIIIEGQA